MTYFDDAEREPMPVMQWDDDWEAVKKAIRSWVKAYAA